LSITMATTFTLTIDLADHEHPGASWIAQHHTVVVLLDRVKQSVGSNPGRRGDITYTGSANGQSYSTTIGSWEFRNDDRVAVSAGDPALCHGDNA
jgi:hypothetical protein